MEAKKAVAVLTAMANKVSPDPAEKFDSEAAVVTDKVAYSALKQGIAAIQSNQESVDLSDLLGRQRKLMNVLGIEKGPVPDILFSPLYKDVLIMMGGEVFEALEPLTLGTKPWKIADSSQLRDHALEELVDVFFFVLEAFELAGLSAAEVERRYEEKRQKNFVRAAGKGRSVMEAKVAEATPVIKDVEHHVLAGAMQRAAGQAPGVNERSVLWQAVWDAEKLESEARAGLKAVDRPITVLLETLRKINLEFSPEGKYVVKQCLMDEIGEPQVKLILEKVGWTDASKA